MEPGSASEGGDPIDSQAGALNGASPATAAGTPHAPTAGTDGGTGDASQSPGARPAYRTRSSSEVLFVEAVHVAVRRGRQAFAEMLLNQRAEDQVRAVDRALDSEEILGAGENDLRVLEAARTAAARQLQHLKTVDVRGLTHEALLSKAEAVVASFSQAMHHLELTPGIHESVERYLERRHRELLVSGTTSEDRPPPATQVEAQKVHPDALVGLALSGGGIRSASFALGALESTANIKLLPAFDFVSSVSGGGYAASWLTTWAYRHRHGVVGVQADFAPEEEVEPGPLRWVRRHCAYLAPRLTSLTSSDVWALVVAYAANWIPVLTLLCLAMVSLLLLPHALLVSSGYLAESPSDGYQSIWRVVAIVIAAGATLGFAGLLRRLTTYYRIPGKKPRYPSGTPEAVFYGTQVCGVLLALTLPWLWAWRVEQLRIDVGGGTWAWSSLYLEVLGVLLGLVLTSSLIAWVLSCTWAQKFMDRVRIWRGVQMPEAGPLVFRKIPLFWRVLSLLISSATAAFFLTAMAWACSRYSPSPALLIGLGPLYLVVAFGVAEIFGLIFVHKFQHDRDRAWAARVGAWLLSSVCAWAALCLVAFAVEPVLQRMGQAPVAASVIGVLAVAALVLWRYVGLVGPVLMLVALAFLSALTHLLVVPLVQALYDSPGTPVWRHEVGLVWLTFFAACFLTYCFSMVSNANRFSLHAVYKEGLVRTFLGASRLGPFNRNVASRPSETANDPEMPQFQSRQPDPVTNIDDHDDPSLSWLRSRPDREVPILLLNAALNGRSRTDLEGRVPRQWPFTFSPYFCGSPAAGVGYGETSAFGGINPTKGLTLGTAMAVSGAAMSPTSGRSTHPVKAMILGILNARLGMWIGNPQNAEAVRSSGPKLAGPTVVREVLGIRDKFDDWIHLSDGGHFENLGIYELLRRGCMRIVAVDASCDPDLGFDDLANAIRRARIDLGIHVVREARWDMPASKPAARNARRTSRPWTWFTIVYGDGLPLGRLLYVKPTVDTVSPLPVEVRNYWKTHPAFPHETTADQFFTEAQMEAYRSLGRWCMSSALEAALQTDSARRESNQDTHGLFAVFKRQAQQRAREDAASVGPPAPQASDPDVPEQPPRNP